MKVTAKKRNKVFEPIELNIIVESEQELRDFRKIFGSEGTVSEALENKLGLGRKNEYKDILSHIYAELMNTQND